MAASRTRQGLGATSRNDFLSGVVYWQRKPVVGPLAWALLRVVGVVIPRCVPVGPGLRLPHATNGLVLHPGTEIGRDVTILHGVTVGRADVWRPPLPGTRIVLGDRVILCANAVVVVKGGETIELAPGTVVGANSVLSQSTGRDEIWAGNPARRVGHRDDVATP